MKWIGVNWQLELRGRALSRTAALLRFALVLFTISPFLRCEDEYVRKACFEGDCENGQGVLVYYRLIYKGKFKDGKMDGQGSMQWAEGKLYQGDWKRGQPDGRGAMRWKDGRKYEGDWQAGRQHGQGVMSFPDGRVYTGSFRGGKMDGYGELIFDDGHKLIGRFKDDVYSGP